MSPASPRYRHGSQLGHHTQQSLMIPEAQTGKPNGKPNGKPLDKTVEAPPNTSTASVSTKNYNTLKFRYGSQEGDLLRVNKDSDLKLNSTRKSKKPSNPSPKPDHQTKTDTKELRKKRLPSA